MNKRFLCIFLVLCVVFSLLPFGATAAEVADSGTCGKNAFWTLDGDTLTISGTGAIYDYTFEGNHGSPAISENYHVNTPWFSVRYQIRKIVVSEGITRLGDFSFYDVTAESIQLPDSLTAIGNYALACSAYSDRAYKTLTLPKNLQVLGDHAIRHTAIKALTVPGSVKTIGTFAIEDCLYLETIIFEEGIEELTGFMYVNPQLFVTMEVPSTLRALELEISRIGDLHYHGTQKQWQNVSLSESIAERIADGTTTIHYRSTAGAPVVMTQPASVTAKEGASAKFTVKAVSGGDPTYQWQYKKAGASTWYNSTSTGNKTATLSVEATKARNGMQFRCVVKNAAGKVASDPATLTVKLKPAISTQPKSVSVKLDGTAQFTVHASGENLTYQWQYLKAGSSTWYNASSTGNKTATLSVEATKARNGMQFRCIVKNANGSVTSSAATLTVLTEPAIKTQPKNVSAVAGDSVTFTVKATGGDLTYQWQYKKAGASTWYNSTSTGNKTATLTVEATTARNGMQFRCIVKNSLGSVTSSAVKLTVK